MKTMEMLIQIVSYLEICAVTIGGVNYLIAIEAGKERKSFSNDVSLVQTYWHLWRFDPETLKFSALKKQAIFLPDLMALHLASNGKELFGLAESNYEFPMVGIQWHNIESLSAKIPEMPNQAMPIRLTSEQIKKVVADSIPDWSTPWVSPVQCLFNPSIMASADHDVISVAFNAANGDAVIREFDSIFAQSRDRLSVRGALDPHYFRLDSRDFLFFRQAPAPISVFHNLPRHTLASVAEELPICLIEFDDSNVVKRTRDLSHDCELGLSYSFDVKVDPKHRVAIATISGDRTKPLLTLFLSEDFGSSWQVKKRELLTELPWRMSLTLNKHEALVSLSFMRPKGFEIGAIRVAI